MKPAILFLSCDYPPALDYFYNQELGAKDKSYIEQKNWLSKKMCRMADFYSLNLAKLGYRTESVAVNDEFLQKQWAKEKGMIFSSFSPPHLARRSFFLRSLISKFPKIYYSLRNSIDKRSWINQIAMAQIKDFEPDITHITDLHFFTSSFLKEIRKYSKKIVGQISSPIMLPDENFKLYDLLISSFPHYLERFKKMGIRAEYLKHAFEPEILKTINLQERKYQCVFVGGLSKDSEGIPLLEEIAKKTNIEFWGHMNPVLNKSSPILLKYHGESWGIDMYKILAQSRIVLNRHIKSVARNYANNMRLFETTGMGAMLITDMKENLQELFEIGKEVETYNSPKELIEKINYYSQHDKEREKIAKAGQERTLRDHTYAARAKELDKIYQTIC